MVESFMRYFTKVGRIRYLTVESFMRYLTKVGRIRYLTVESFMAYLIWVGLIKYLMIEICKLSCESGNYDELWFWCNISWNLQTCDIVSNQLNHIHNSK